MAAANADGAQMQCPHLMPIDERIAKNVAAPKQYCRRQTFAPFARSDTHRHTETHTENAARKKNEKRVLHEKKTFLAGTISLGTNNTNCVETIQQNKPFSSAFCSLIVAMFCFVFASDSRCTSLIILKDNNRQQLALFVRHFHLTPQRRR